MGSYGSDNFYPTFDKKINVVKNVDTSAPQLCRVRMETVIFHSNLLGGGATKQRSYLIEEKIPIND